MRAPGTTDALIIRPAHLHIVDPALASRVAAPAFDALPVAARTARGADPLSYLHVLRANDADRGRRRNRRALQRLLRDGVFDRGAGRRFAWYRLATADGHVQTGLVAEVAIRDYDEGRIVRHEHTRADREQRLAAFQRAVAADASPVALAYRAQEELRALGRRAVAARPHVRFTADDRVEHALWPVADGAAIDEIEHALAGIERLYVTDGHHRLAAASQVAGIARAAGAGRDAPDQWILAALFPHDELRILPFHRAVTGPFAPTRRLLADLAAHVAVRPLAEPAAPARPHTFTAWIDGGWHRLEADAGAVGTGALAALDVTVLQEQVLAPVLGIREPRIDPRLTYVAGSTAAVAEHCARLRAVGFMVRPTTMRQLMWVADTDGVMPPKSTLFSPKACAGVVLRLSS